MEYERAISRHGPLVMSETWAKAIKKNVEDRFNIKTPLAIFIYENDTIASYRQTKLLYEELPPLVSRWVEESDEIYQLYEENENAIKWLKRRVVGEVSNEILKSITECSNNFIRGYGGIFFSYWLSLWEQDRLKHIKLFQEELLREARKMREKDTLHADTVSFFNKCLAKLAEKEQWEYETLQFMAIEEITASIKSKNIDTLYNKRKEGYAYFKDTLIVDDFRNALKNYKIELKDDNYDNNKEIVGTTACRGCVTGKAKIVISSKQIGNVNKGDIMISCMTTPDFVPAMEKAAAFVTDEGGVLCHAAIIAREMQKPCVIGTKIATKVFKN